MKNDPTRAYQDLEVWKQSMILAEEVYDVAKLLPGYEQFGLMAQMRRAAVSIPSNIAEGQKRFSNKDTVHFTGIALGSLAELETQLLLCRQIHNVDVEKSLGQCAIVARMLHALIRALRTKL